MQTQEYVLSQESNASASDLSGAVKVASAKAPFVVEDTSGLSAEQVRDIAEQEDANVTEEAVKEIVESIEDNTTSIRKPKKRKSAAWESLSPKPDGYDWVQTDSGEWFKGEIIALYDKKLEFDSKEVGDYSFKMKDITQIKSFHVISVNIEGVASIAGIVRMKDDNVTIIQGDAKYTFRKDQVVSAAPAGAAEKDRWTGKVSVSTDRRLGNKNQFDYTASATLKRRTADTRLRLDYLGRISAQDGVETSNDHRVNESYDVYYTRNLFWKAISSEYYKDRFQNIRGQFTVGSGLGYTIIDTSRTEWDITTGPAIVYTNYETVKEGESDTHLSPAWEFSTHLDREITKMIDLDFAYRLTYTDDPAGRYKHHMVLKLENELTSWLDLDLSTIWDYTEKPTAESDGNVPFKSDFQFIVGLGIEF